MQYLNSALFVLIAITMVGCSSSGAVSNGSIPSMTNDQLLRSNELVDGVPIWISMPPADDENYLYSVSQATGASFTQQATMLTVENLARQAMSSKLESKVQALQRNFLETVTSADQQNYDATFTNVNKVTTEQSLNNTRVARSRCLPIPQGDRPSGNVNERCFMVMSMPVGQAKQAYENALSRDEELYTKFKASQAYQDLQNEFSQIGNE